MRCWLLTALLVPALASADEKVGTLLYGGIFVDSCGSLVDGRLTPAVALRSPDILVGEVEFLTDVRGANRITLSYSAGGTDRSFVIDATANICEWDALQRNNNRSDTIVIGDTPELQVALLIQLTREIDADGDAEQRTHAYSYTAELRNLTGAPVTDVVLTWAALPSASGVSPAADVFTSSRDGLSRDVATATFAAENAAMALVTCSGGSVEFAADMDASSAASPDPNGGISAEAMRFRSDAITVAPYQVSAVSFGLVTAAADDANPVSVASAVFETCDRDDEDDGDQDGLLSTNRGGSDCDNSDPNVGAGLLYWLDADGDGFGTPEVSAYMCSPDSDYVLATAGPADCDDSDADVNPDADELGNSGVDSNCDGLFTCFADADDDGFGSSETVASVDADCTGEGESDNNNDCDDSSADIHPDATEVSGNLVDEDCDGMLQCVVDADLDGYGGVEAGDVLSDDLDCDDEGEALSADDCDDSDPSIHPGATEIVGNNIDEDCDGDIYCYADNDNDGYSGVSSVPADDGDCDDEGESTFGGDCDDDDPSIHPGATEIVGNTIDEDCSGTVECWDDFDGDGFGSMDVAVNSSDLDCDDPGEAALPNDCDDNNADIHPDAQEIPGNAIDEDCDGIAQDNPDGDDTYLGGGRTRCSTASGSPMLGGLALMMLGLAARRRRLSDSERTQCD